MGVARYQGLLRLVVRIAVTVVHHVLVRTDSFAHRHRDLEAYRRRIIFYLVIVGSR